VLKAFDEEQVFRIDHYLGKQTVQNILVFRFANSMFEPIWHRNYVDFIEITGRKRSEWARAPDLRGDRSPARHGCQPYAPASHPHRDGTSVAFDAVNVREQKCRPCAPCRP